MSVVAALFTIMVLILGIICQRNFGYGLSNYRQYFIYISDVLARLMLLDNFS